MQGLGGKTLLWQGTHWKQVNELTLFTGSLAKRFQLDGLQIDFSHPAALKRPN